MSKATDDYNRQYVPHLTHTFHSEHAAWRYWQELVNRGVSVSLLGFDTTTELYVFDEFLITD